MIQPLFLLHFNNTISKTSYRTKALLAPLASPFETGPQPQAMPCCPDVCCEMLSHANSLPLAHNRKHKKWVWQFLMRFLNTTRSSCATACFQWSRFEMVNAANLFHSQWTRCLVCCACWLAPDHHRLLMLLSFFTHFAKMQRTMHLHAKPSIQVSTPCLLIPSFKRCLLCCTCWLTPDPHRLFMLLL
jgi:hypothetical protein